MKPITFFLALCVATVATAANSISTYTAEEIATQNSWKTGTCYTSFVMDGVITVAAHQPDSGKINGYYSPDEPRDWRIYQARNNGEFEISIKQGYTIKSVVFTYTTTKNGVLSLLPGMSIGEKDQVKSGASLPVNASSIVLYAGNTGTGGAGQVRISRFTITYANADSAAVVEGFSQVDQTKNNDAEVTWQGDYADWKVLNARRNAKDTLNGGVQGSWCKGGGYFKTTAQGGIKRLSFDWRQFVTDSVELMLAMSADTLWRDTVRLQAIPQQAISKNQHYEAIIQCKQDVPLSFMNLSTIVEKDRFLLGDIYITPYLYIAPANRSIHFDRSDGSFDLSTILLDNTEGEGQIVYTIVSDATLGATLNGSVVDFSQARASGDIKVQVSWNEGLVSLTPVTLHIMVPSAEDEFFTETFSRCTKTQMSGTTYVVGDKDVYTWNLSNFSRTASDTLLGAQAVCLNYSGGMTMNGAQEGGIKSVRFSWRATSAKQPVHFVVYVDGDPHDVKYTAAQQAGNVMQYTSTFNMDYNTALGITLPAKESTTQSKIVVSPISIAPYLLFRTKKDTVDLKTVTSYNLDSAVINNTGTTAIYTILSDETGAAIFVDGVLDLSAVTQNGAVKVQAQWGEVTTTLTIYAQHSTTDLPITYHPSPLSSPTKILRDGQLLLLRDGATYTILGLPL